MIEGLFELISEVLYRWFGWEKPGTGKPISLNLQKEGAGRRGVFPKRAAVGAGSRGGSGAAAGEDRKAGDGERFLSQSARSRPLIERRAMVEVSHRLPVVRRCSLLAAPRSSFYYRAAEASAVELALMRQIDEIHLRFPFYGSRRIGDELETRGVRANRKKDPAADPDPRTTWVNFM